MSDENSARNSANQTITKTPEAWGARVILVLPPVGELVLQPIEANTLLEIAYLAMAIDGDVPDSEIEAFRALSLRLRGLVDPDAAPLSELDVSNLLGVFGRRAPKGREIVRLNEIASQLEGAPLRELAYTITFAMTLVDFATTDEEIEIDRAVRDAFDIDDARAEALRARVFEHIDAA